MKNPQMLVIIWRIDESLILDVYIESLLISNQVLQRGQCELLFDV